MIILEYNHEYFHDYFNEYPVSNIKATFMESLGVGLLLSTVQVLLLLIIIRLSGTE